MLPCVAIVARSLTEAPVRPERSTPPGALDSARTQWRWGTHMAKAVGIDLGTTNSVIAVLEG
ncbi:MAG: hypothetical protein ACRDPL_09690, partial [Propionibacteriaceae bacterium]